MRLRYAAKETKNALIRNRNQVIGHLTELFRQINHKMLVQLAANLEKWFMKTGSILVCATASVNRTWTASSLVYLAKRTLVKLHALSQYLKQRSFCPPPVTNAERPQPVLRRTIQVSITYCQIQLQIYTAFM
jgi:hypothetical protein